MYIPTIKERLAVQFNLLPAPIYDAFPAVLFGRLLVLASKFGLFEALLPKPQTVDELARSLSLPLKSIELLCQSLSVSAYLNKKGEKYFLSRRAKKWLVKSSPYYLGNFLRYIELIHSHWMYLEKTLHDGSPPATYVETFGATEWEIYTLGMMDLARLMLPHLLPNLILPDRPETLLDVGGSHGLYSIELCKRHPSLAATIADFPNVLTTTRRIVHEHHLEQRITTMPCNIVEVTFPPESFDAVLAFNIVHGFDKETNGKILRTISASLKHRGVLYILDQLKNSGGPGIDSFLPLMVGLNLLNEIGGNVYSFEEIRSLCTEAGFTTIRQYRLKLPGVSLVRAVKR